MPTIFFTGGELEEMVRNLPGERPLVLKVGVADVVPKSITYRLLAPALQLPESVRIECRENTFDSLLAELSVHLVKRIKYATISTPFQWNARFPIRL